MAKVIIKIEKKVIKRHQKLLPPKEEEDSVKSTLAQTKMEYALVLKP